METPLKLKLSSAFTLVELSVVLIVIGLLVGSIMVGASILDDAKLKSLIRDGAFYKKVILDFQNKYNELPGDMTAATNYWSSSGNGDGDGLIEWSGESYRAWQHLYLASLVKEVYNGTSQEANCVYNTGCVLRIETPVVSIYNRSGSLPSSVYVAAGVYNAGSFWNPLLPPAEAFKIDSKIDNGIATTGQVMGRSSVANDCVRTSGGVAIDYTSTSTGYYNLTKTTAACNILFYIFE
jgi:prepilin-type N-terminal cleavage/methylation domain-containing protein